METKTVAVHARRHAARPPAGDRSEPLDDPAVARFFEVFTPPFRADLWSTCPPTQSPHPDDLAPFWDFLRANALARLRLSRALEPRYRDCDAIGDDELPGFLMLLELRLVRREYARCIADAEALTVRYPGDLRVQDIRARAILLGEDDSALAADPSYAYKPFARLYCPSTFNSLCFFEHGAYICCCNYQPTSIGPTASRSTDELWNGAVAQDIRRSILDASFRYCNKMVCPRLRNRDLPLRSDPTLSDYDRNIIANAVITSPGCLPSSIELNEDPSCNLACPSCRDAPVHRDSQFLRDFERDVLPGVLDHELNSFLVACYGEPFASAHYLRVLHGLDPLRHPIRKLVIYTNGTLFTPAKWCELSNLHAYSIEVRISVDAATAPTYAKLRPGIGRAGDWNALVPNLEFVGGLRKAGRIAALKLFFVVQEGNFREMPAFVALAKSLGADEIVFSEMQKFGRYFGDDALYARKAFHVTAHPDHAAYRRTLSDASLDDPTVAFHGCRVRPGVASRPEGAPFALPNAPDAERGFDASAPTKVESSMDYVWAGDANARTMANSVAIPGDGEFHLVMALPLNKHSTRSNWFYTAQITFQQGTPGMYGAQFRMEVRRNSDGASIMSPMMTGQLVHAPNVFMNATLCDTVQDRRTLIEPPAGDYTFELHALSGGGTLLVLGTMTTISVLEIPHPQIARRGRVIAS